MSPSLPYLVEKRFPQLLDVDVVLMHDKLHHLVDEGHVSVGPSESLPQPGQLVRAAHSGHQWLPHILYADTVSRGTKRGWNIT